MLVGLDRAGQFGETPLFASASRPESVSPLDVVQLPPGSQLGPYQILSLLGAGGMPLCDTDAREHLRAHDNQVVRARTGWATAMDVHASVVLQLNQPQLGAEGKKTSAPKQH